MQSQNPTYDFSSGSPAGGATTGVPVGQPAGFAAAAPTSSANMSGFGAANDPSNVPYSPPNQMGGAAPGVMPDTPATGGVPQQQQPPADTGGYKGIHPIAAIFHVAFKLGALLTFILGGIFGSSFVLVFIITVLFAACDFWTTKNVTGRLLVALRWWNRVNEDGSTEWVFESSPDSESRVNGYDNWFFWITTVAYTAVWLLFCIFSLLSFDKLAIAIVCFLLAGANFWGYFKCRRDAKARVTEFMMRQAVQRPDAMRAAASVAVNAATGAPASPAAGGASTAPR